MLAHLALMCLRLHSPFCFAAVIEKDGLISISLRFCYDALIVLHAAISLYFAISPVLAAILAEGAMAYSRYFSRRVISKKINVYSVPIGGIWMGFLAPRSSSFDCIVSSRGKSSLETRIAVRARKSVPSERADKGCYCYDILIGGRYHGQ